MGKEGMMMMRGILVHAGAAHQETWWEEPAVDRGNDAMLVWGKVEVLLGCPGEV